MLRQRHTVTFFTIGARVMLASDAAVGEGELIGIGRKYLVVRLDSGRIVRRVAPPSITRPSKGITFTA
jgi:hypothetical protein